jgi:transposase
MIPEFGAQDVEEMCTVLYWLVDECYQPLAQAYDHRPGPPPACSDSELITLSLLAELWSMDEEVAFLAYMRRHWRALFPVLPERSRYNRRRRALQRVTAQIRRQVLRLLDYLQPLDDLALIDSLPVPVVGFAHAGGHHRWRGLASYGYNAAKKLTFYGFKLHLLATHGGLILDFALAPAHLGDGTLSETLLRDKPAVTVLGDKAYLNAPLQAALRAEQGVVLLTPTRANQRVQQDPALTHLITHFRQAIETLNSQLSEQFHIECNKAKSLDGLCARVQAKLTAHTVGHLLNALAHRPPLALKHFALI